MSGLTRLFLLSFSVPVSIAGAQARLQPTVRYTAQERVRILADAIDPRASLSVVPAAALMPDGTLVVGQPSEALFRIFDSTGHFVRTLGRSGQGPGEFSRIADFGHVGDTLFVVDHRNRRLSLFRGAKAEPQAIQLPILLVPNGGYPRLLALLRGGGAISEVTREVRDSGTIIDLYLHDRTGKSVTKFDTFREAAYYTPVKIGQRTLSFPQHFLARPFAVFSAASGRIATIETIPQSSRGGSQATIRITWRESGGGTAVDNFAVAVSPLTRSEVDSAIDAFARNLSTAFAQTGSKVPATAIRDEITKIAIRPGFRPVVRQAFVDDDGRVWLRRHGDTEWLVLTRGSVTIEGVMFPAEGQLLAIRGRTAWVQQLDKDDLPVLIRYELVESAVR